MTWVNDDGLVVKFGVEESVHRNIGAYNVYGPVHELEVLVNYEELPSVSDGNTIVNEGFVFPEGALIEEVEVVPATTDFDDTSGSTATLSVGFVDADDRSTNSVKAALVDAATDAELNTGGTNVGGWSGSAVGTVLDEPRLLTWEVDAEAFTAGVGTIRVRWSIPPKNEDTLAWSK